jgi:outer membrane protein assembly factor BamD
MLRRALVCFLLAVVVMGVASCHNKKVHNPIANLDSKQPDKVLFDKAMDAMKHNKFEVARMTLQTLINTYPDSEFLARAKLAVGDSWYAEGNTAALAQAESEYKDFITFFPNMPEAAEAQLRIADIHYQQMEKPDRDFTHAKRAEDEYRQLILQFPDSKLVPQAKERLRQVQEVLAEREFRIGRFYYLRQSWPAAIARLKSVTDAYPLYSGADEALTMLGDAYQQEGSLVEKNPRLSETARGKLAKEFNDQAAQAFSRIVTRYPLSGKSAEAKRRLEAMHRPVPTPTPEALAENKAEMESRGKTGLIGGLWTNFHKRPDMSQAARVGEPTLVDPKPANAAEMVRHATDIATGKDTHAVAVEPVKEGAPAPNEPAPRSSQPAGTQDDPNAIPELKPLADSGTTTVPGGSSETAAPAAAPAQVNEADSADAQAQAAAPTSSSTAVDPLSSSSKQKKKKGLGKLNPF